VAACPSTRAAANAPRLTLTLEFSFGRVRAAQAAVARALEISPRNAQAHALEGFLALAGGRVGKAEDAFAAALAIDPMLGNAWLGRGLGRVRAGLAGAGRADLETAAALEPNRSLLRSYLGKAFAHEAQHARGIANRMQLRALAMRELALAAEADRLDPTPWLYLALLQHDEFRTAAAIQNLEVSQRRNANRAVYRSQFLLDQDQAVRSANLASIFADADMLDVSVRESARAVSLDYANFSAHLNLANSYNQLRDPTRFNLRFETEWFNEHLLASLLAPPGAVSLSQNVSQQEYTRLFAANRFGLASTTEYLGTGEYRETAAQFGAFGGTSYSLDVEYQHNDGVRVNNGLDRLEWYSRFKQQVTAQDSMLVLTKYQDYEAGDNFQYYNPSNAHPGFEYSQTQAPLLLAGWHREWSPGSHTLFLGGRLVNEQAASDTGWQDLVALGVIPPFVQPFDSTYRSRFEVYSAELNQILERGRHTDILGLRFQDGTFSAENTFTATPRAWFFALPSRSTTDNEFRRVSPYAYHHWEIVDGLLLAGGVTYDDLRYPANFRRPPLSTDEDQQSQVSPKVALLWDIVPAVRARAVYAQALGGVSYDESVRLEPTQLAGFSQSFRSLISESLVGSVETPRYDIAGGALDIRPWAKAWMSLQGEARRERVDRQIGYFDLTGPRPAIPANTAERLDYHEYEARLVWNQIVDRDWFLEAQYRFTRSELERAWPDIPAPVGYERTTRWAADLHQVQIAATWQHPSGVFARGAFVGMLQELRDAAAAEGPGDRFPMLNLYAGYRFPHRRAELTLGVLNVLGDDYHFSPVTYHPEYPHERAFFVRFHFNF
jgi:hypothetical protein